MEQKEFSSVIWEIVKLTKELVTLCEIAKKKVKDLKLEAIVHGTKVKPYEVSVSTYDLIFKVVFKVNSLFREYLDEEQKKILLQLMQAFNQLILVFPGLERKRPNEQIKYIFHISLKKFEKENKDKGLPSLDFDLLQELIRFRNNIYLED